jgi:hypothetical protein
VNTRCSSLIICSFALFLILPCTLAQAQNRRTVLAGSAAVVVDERLSVLRASPSTSAKFLRRVGRGRPVTILGQSLSREGIVFYRVAVSSRTRGWMQRESLVSARQPRDDERLLRLIKGSEDFDLIARSRIFLDTFPRSRLRPAVLLLIGDAAERAAARLSRDATRRLNTNEMKAGDAPNFSYFLNYSGLDRYSRQGVKFIFDRAEKRFYYDGAAWREILRRHPRSYEADEARRRLR